MAPSKPAPTTPGLHDLAVLRPDPRNARRRTERSGSMIEQSLRKFGAARSLVVDEHGVVLAGNGTLEAAAAIGIEKVIIVPADGNTLIAVQRSDLSETQKAEYAIADNRSSDLSEFDPTVLVENLELLPDLDLSPYWTDEEFKVLTDGMTDPGPGEKEKDPTTSLTVTLAFPDQAAKDLFLGSTVQLAARVPNLTTMEERLQFALDRFFSI